MPERIAVTTSSFGDAQLAPLRERGFEIALNPTGRKLEPTETVDLLEACAGVIAGTEVYDAAVLAALPDLAVISRVGVGMDSIDPAAAVARGVVLVNTPDGPTRSVAELTIAVTLDLLRRVSRMDREIRSGVWKKRTGNLLAEKRVGIVGLGRIGRAAAALFEALGARVAFCDVCDPIGDVSYPRMSMDELLPWADIVTLHCSGQACAVVGAREIALMKEGAWLVNVARGGLVDEEALLTGLEAGRLAGAALDVFEHEPYAGPLCGRDDVILTPHVGSYALEGRIAMEEQAVANLIEALDARADR